MSEEKRVQIKRAILSELNKELAKKSRSLSATRPASKKPPQVGSSLAAHAHPVKLHKHKLGGSKTYSAQPFVDSATKGIGATCRNGDVERLPGKQSNVTIETGKKVQIRGKRVIIPQPTPRTVHPPPPDRTVHPPTPRTVHPPPPDPRYEHVLKFAKVWISNTFQDGRDDFSKAVVYRRTCQLKSCLGLWKERTYEKQVEWKLAVRADCHYRFYLKERHWDVWRRFLDENREYSEKKRQADEFCREMLKRRYVGLLRKAVAKQKDEKANKVVADAVYRRNLLSAVLIRWNKARVERDIEIERENIALHFWSLALQRRCLDRWVNYKQQRKVIGNMKVAVDSYYNGKLLQRALRCLVAYKQQRKVKQIAVRRSEKLLKSKLQHKFFFLWTDQAYISQKTRTMEEQLLECQGRFKSRRILLHWQQYCEIRKKEREALVTAQLHARLKLLGKCFNGFRSYNRHQKKTILLNEVAAKATRKAILAHCFGNWVSRYDEAEEEKLKYRTLMARKHDQLKSMHTCLSTWRNYTRYRAGRKDCYSLADSHYHTTLTQQVFTSWHLYIGYRRTVKIKSETAALHRHDLLYHKYFYTWVRMFHVSQNHRQDERMAVLHHNKTALSRAFSRLLVLSVERKYEREKGVAADTFYRNKLMDQGMRAFRNYKTYHSKKLDQEGVADRHFYHTVGRKCMKAWVEHVLLKKCETLKRKAADDHYNHKLAAGKLRQWLSYHAKLKKARSTICFLEADRSQKFLRKCLLHWSSQVRLFKMSRDLNLRAEYHHRSTLLGRVVRSWLTFTEQQARDHVTKALQLEEAVSILDMSKRQRCFALWRNRTECCQRERVKREKAEENYRNMLLKQGILGLKRNVDLSFKKLVLQRKLQNFVLHHPVRRAFEKLKSHFEEQLRENAMTEKALWFW